MSPSITDVERMRLGLQVIQEAVGSENYLLGCSAVFGPCIGFVDGIRTGGDIHPRFEAFPERVLANAGNSYLTGKVFNGDADCLVFAKLMMMKMRQLQIKKQERRKPEFE